MTFYCESGERAPACSQRACIMRHDKIGNACRATDMQGCVQVRDMREQLADATKSKEGAELFEALYRSWSHSVGASLCLCFLAQAYGHACDLIAAFSHLPLGVEVLVQVISPSADCLCAMVFGLSTRDLMNLQGSGCCTKRFDLVLMAKTSLHTTLRVLFTP